MSDWGDFTPGPWIVQHDRGTRTVDLAPDWQGFILNSYGLILARYAEDADARLISKAYLIPRLEAALAAALNTDELPPPEWDQAATALLEELESP